MNKAIQVLLKQGILWFAEKSGGSSINEGLRRLSFGIDQIDATLPFRGLPLAATHEFIMLPPSEDISAYPPCTLPLVFAERSFSYHINRQTRESPFLVFIGKQCWPSAYLLQSLFLYHQDLLPNTIQSHMLFLDPSEKKHLWCIEKSLRSPAVSTIVSTLHHCPLALSKRFSLLAKQHGTTALFIRPPSELSSRGFFSSRWTIAHKQSLHPGPVWHIHLRHIQGTRSYKNNWNLYLRCKEDYEHNNLQQPALSLHILPNDRKRYHKEGKHLASEQTSRLYHAS